MKKRPDKPSRSKRIGAAAHTAADSDPETEETRTVQEGPAMNCPVVAIGASAGGLDALKRFFGAMPAGGGLSFVVIVHLDPTHVSHMPELLGRCTAMPVTQAQEGEAVQPNHVHVIPPDKYLTLSRGVLHLGDRAERPGIPMPIDRFFSSLAEDQEERAIGILLSGSGSDGTLGLKEIKASGGLMLVQIPETAEHEGMPQSAIATGLVDYILRVEDMPEVLLQYVAHARLGSPAMSLPADTEKDPFHAILALLQAQGRLDFRCYKPGLPLRRIRRRMGLAQCGQMADYLQFLRETPHEVDALIRDLLIGVTSFFREPEAWQVLAAEVMPRLLAAKPNDTSLRVWVPGCATGEEAYSIGMLLLEQVKTTDHSGKIQIFATDIDREALEAGRAGIYSQSIAASVPPERLQRFFTETPKGYQVTEALRKTVVFAPHNLITDPPFSRMDLISCRNLLIYFQPKLQQKLFGLFHFALNEGGYLFLGKSETTTQRPGLFQPVSNRWRLYQRLASARPILPELPADDRVRA